MNPSHADSDNRSNQMNPNNDAYWQSRGGSGRPQDSGDEDDEDAQEWERMKRGMLARMEVRRIGNAQFPR